MAAKDTMEDDSGYDDDDCSCVDLYAVIEGRARKKPSATAQKQKPNDSHHRQSRSRSSDRHASEEEARRENDAIRSKLRPSRNQGSNNLQTEPAYIPSITKPTAIQGPHSIIKLKPPAEGRSGSDAHLDDNSSSRHSRGSHRGREYKKGHEMSGGATRSKSMEDTPSSKREPNQPTRTTRRAMRRRSSLDNGALVQTHNECGEQEEEGGSSRHSRSNFNKPTRSKSTESCRAKMSRTRTETMTSDKDTEEPNFHRTKPSRSNSTESSRGKPSRSASDTMVHGELSQEEASSKYGRGKLSRTRSTENVTNNGLRQEEFSPKPSRGKLSRSRSNENVGKEVADSENNMGKGSSHSNESHSSRKPSARSPKSKQVKSLSSDNQRAHVERTSSHNKAREACQKAIHHKQRESDSHQRVLDRTAQSRNKAKEACQKAIQKQREWKELKANSVHTRATRGLAQHQVIHDEQRARLAREACLKALASKSQMMLMANMEDNNNTAARPDSPESINPNTDRPARPSSRTMDRRARSVSRPRDAKSPRPSAPRSINKKRATSPMPPSSKIPPAPLATPKSSRRTLEAS